MSTTKYSLTHDVWRRISAAGESGTCWVKKIGEAGNGIFIDHTTTPGAGPPDTIDVGSPEETAAGLNKDKAFYLADMKRILEIPADNASDVYYAVYEDKYPNSPSTGEITADVI
jgi:hypothetical protein